ncbi:MAG: glycoside hydrolase, partial [Sulfurimonadaceae bacterium]|nr:glycoside hydrolase [Sulfurimonadaceae bacterium]
LYIGTYDDNIMILHNMWGVKTTNGKENGRKLVGGTVISTLHIGSELKSYDEENDLLRQLESMNIITAEPSPQQ